MPYIEVTEELIKIIREERKRNKISGEKLAEAIEKSRAFISQLENGKINFIELDILHTILKATSKLSDEEYNNYVEDLLRKIQVPLSLEVIQKEEWMYVFDLQIRKFLIPEDIISFITSKCEELGITYEELVSEINKNKNLQFASTYESNKVNVFFHKDHVGWAIRFDLEKDYVSRICEKNQKRISYVNILAIIYNLYLLEGKSEEESQSEAEKFLLDNDIITILQRDKKRSENMKIKIDSGEEFEKEDLEVTECDKKFRKAYNVTNFYFELLCDKKPSEAHEYLTQLNKNFDTDWNLMLAIMKMPLDQFEPLPFSERKQFFKEFIELVEKYKNKAKEYDGNIEYL